MILERWRATATVARCPTSDDAFRRRMRWLARQAQLAAALVVAAACQPRPETSASTDASSASPPRDCTGGPRNVPDVLKKLRAVHEARVSELDHLISGSRRRLQGGDGPAVEEIRRYPSCPSTSEGVLRARVERALDAFFTRKEAQPHRGERGRVIAGVGCEEDGDLLVSLRLGLGLGEDVQATYRVGARSAKLIVDGLALAHADLDGDGQRDVVWQARDRHVSVRFAASERVRPTPLKVPECEDTDCFFAAAPSLERSFAMVLVHRASGPEIRERLRWSGTEFVPVDRLTDDDFETRYEALRERELAVLDDPMFGSFGKLRGELERCADVPTIDAGCSAVFDSAVTTLARGGLPGAEARAMVRSYLGWSTCAPTDASAQRR